MNLLLSSFAALAILAACDGAQQGESSLDQTSRVAPPLRCPISGAPVSDEKFVAYFQVYPVYCASAVDAAEFGALPLGKRAEAAKAQVLPQKGISNLTCPLTGQPLTAVAMPITYQSEVIGFASTADANQFLSLKPDQQEQLVSRWRTSERAALTVSEPK
ncbi:MAG: hypothetical protein EXS00_05415 [Phycisphaerales bacterium]|nr:hypothetical protein [Phycisphaerales bacterium]